MALRLAVHVLVALVVGVPGIWWMISVVAIFLTSRRQ
jgi:hypothetical protein